MCLARTKHVIAYLYVKNESYRFIIFSSTRSTKYYFIRNPYIIDTEQFLQKILIVPRILEK